jgi:hypothetical protein
MKFSNTFLSVFVLLATPIVLAAQISYDPMYDIKTQSLATVACSDGSNGMLTKGFNTFSDLPTFPYIGGGKAVAGYNSLNCGQYFRRPYPFLGLNLCRDLLESNLSKYDHHYGGYRHCYYQ